MHDNLELEVKGPWFARKEDTDRPWKGWSVYGVSPNGYPQLVASRLSEMDARTISQAHEAMDLIDDIVMGRLTPAETLKRGLDIRGKYENAPPRCHECGKTGELVEHAEERMHAECVGLYEQVSDERRLKRVF